MKPAPFEYHCPATLDEAVALLGSVENAKVLAGGQSLMPMLNMRFVICDHIIDLNALDELNYLRRDGDVLRIGAMTRQCDILRSPLVRDCLPVLSEALRYTGHTQTRNRGTMAGSLCHLDPAAEQPTVALLCDAEVVAAGSSGKRIIPITDFIVSYMTTQLAPDEIVSEIRIPLWRKDHGSAFVEFARRHGDFALASVGAMLSFDSRRTIDRCAIAIGGVASVPIRLRAAEALLVGKPASDDSFQAAAQACADIDAVEDVHASAGYRKKLVATLLVRALQSASQRSLSHA